MHLECIKLINGSPSPASRKSTYSTSSACGPPAGAALICRPKRAARAGGRIAGGRGAQQGALRCCMLRVARPTEAGRAVQRARAHLQHGGERPAASEIGVNASDFHGIAWRQRPRGGRQLRGGGAGGPGQGAGECSEGASCVHAGQPEQESRQRCYWAGSSIPDGMVGSRELRPQAPPPPSPPTAPPRQQGRRRCAARRRARPPPSPPAPQRPARPGRAAAGLPRRRRRRRRARRLQTAGGPGRGQSCVSVRPPRARSAAQGEWGRDRGMWSRQMCPFWQGRPCILLWWLTLECRFWNATNPRAFVERQ